MIAIHVTICLPGLYAHHQLAHEKSESSVPEVSTSESQQGTQLLMAPDLSSFPLRILFESVLQFLSLEHPQRA